MQKEHLQDYLFNSLFDCIFFAYMHNKVKYNLYSNIWRSLRIWRTFSGLGEGRSTRNIFYPNFYPSSWRWLIQMFDWFRMNSRHVIKIIRCQLITNFECFLMIFFSTTLLNIFESWSNIFPCLSHDDNRRNNLGRNNTSDMLGNENHIFRKNDNYTRTSEPSRLFDYNKSTNIIYVIKVIFVFGGRGRGERVTHESCWAGMWNVEYFRYFQ